MRAMVVSSTLRFGGVLEYPEDHELGGSHGGDADFAHQSTIEDVILRHRPLIAGNEERLLFSASEQRSEPPLRAQEQPDRVRHSRPQLGVIGLEDDPLRTLVDRSLEKD